MAEKFAFDQFRGNGCAVYFDKGSSSAGTVLMQGAGHQLFACPVRSGDQDPGIGGGHFFDDVLHLLNGFGFTDHFVALTYFSL